MNTKASTILDRLDAHAAATPNKVIYVYLRDDGTREAISFGELQRRVGGVASTLATRFALGERVALVLPPGLEFIVAFLATMAAGLIAVPANLYRRNRSIERLESILADSMPAIIVGPQDDGALTAALHDVGWNVPMAHLAELEAAGTPDHRDCGRRHSPIALLQYTSGSTGRARGVIVTHSNLMCNERQIQLSFGHSQDARLVSWLPLFHDMGLIGCVLQSLYVGFTCVLLSPVSFLREPARWLRTITEFRATTTGAPNFAFDHCVRTVDAEQKKTLDLSSLKVAFNGSEPVRTDTIERFAAAFAECGFRKEAFLPCYGLAEATLFVSGGPAGRGARTICVSNRDLEEHRLRHVSETHPSARKMTSSGHVADGTEVLIVKPDSQRICPAQTVGEIWIASGGVAAGYWNDESDTRMKFDAVLPSHPDRKYLRTGDTGVIDGDDLFIVGRIKDVIIVRGRNIYPQDVEAIAEKALGCKRANSVAAFGVESDGGEGLAIVAEVDEGLNRILRKQRAADGGDDREAAALVGRLREAISDSLDVALSSVWFVKFGTFPRTSSGKLQRSACMPGICTGKLKVVSEFHLGRGRRVSSDSVG